MVIAEVTIVSKHRISRVISPEFRCDLHKYTNEALMKMTAEGVLGEWNYHSSNECRRGRQPTKSI